MAPSVSRTNKPNPLLRFRVVAPALRVSSFPPQAGFWYNFVVGVREYKPHLFKHNCKKCFRSGLMKCPKCDGHGMMERVARDERRAMTIQRRMTEFEDNGGFYDCNYCNGKGVKECTTCQGQGWELMPFINYRKFQPHPVFEDYHWARGKWKAKNRDLEKTIEKRTLDETVEKLGDQRKAREREMKAAKKAAKAAKAAKKKNSPNAKPPKKQTA